MLKRLLILTGLIVVSIPALAQDMTPGFKIPQAAEPAPADTLDIDFDEAFDDIDNPYFSDSIKLNYQVSLLEKMVARQAELDKIAESYKAMGLTFDAPAPSRGICAQLPANAPCLKFYPELYDDLVSERKAFYEEQMAALQKGVEGVQGESDAEAQARKAAEEAEAKARAAEKERKERYVWTDISCHLGNCSGVVNGGKEDNKGFRATVRQGTRLSDGTRIQTITTRGITAIVDGHSVHLRPAPAEEIQKTDSASVETPTQPEDVEPALETVSAQNAGQPAPPPPERMPPGSSTPTFNPTAGTGETNLETPSSQAGTSRSDGIATPAGQTTVEPTLGPSGLF